MVWAHPDSVLDQVLQKVRAAARYAVPARSRPDDTYAPAPARQMGAKRKLGMLFVGSSISSVRGQHPGAIRPIHPSPSERLSAPL